MQSTDKAPSGVLKDLLPFIETSHYWVKNKGRIRHVDRALDDAALRAHLNPAEDTSIGCSLIRRGESLTSCAVIDIDNHADKASWEEVLDAGRKVRIELLSRGLHTTAFRSTGGAGAHIYILWAKAQDAYSVRRMLNAAIEPVRKSCKTVDIEVFPKQDDVAKSAYGSPITLPLTGKSALLINNEVVTFAIAAGLEEIDMLWHINDVDVPLQKKQERKIGGMIKTDLEELKSALEHIPNGHECLENYDRWLKTVFGIHHASQGSGEGLKLAHDFSRRSSKYDELALDSKWKSMRSDENRTLITGNSVLRVARSNGWSGVAASAIAPKLAAQEVDEEIMFSLDREGRPKGTPGNVNRALRNTAYCGVNLTYDKFKSAALIADSKDPKWRPVQDTDYARIRTDLSERWNTKVPLDDVRTEMAVVAEDKAIDSAMDWIKSLPEWDGIPRIASFFPVYTSSEDTPYTRACGLYLWTALAARIISPGCEAPMSPILIGAQGCGKTRTVKAIAPDEESYCSISLADRDADTSRLMRGRIVIELGELRGLYDRDLEAVKEFLSRRSDSWIPKYKEFAIDCPRRHIFIGTSNRNEILQDETGERRWLPIRVDTCSPERVGTDRDQLWAEGYAMYSEYGIVWTEAEKLGRIEHPSYKISDPWADDIIAWLDSHADTEDANMTTSNLALGALGLETKQLGRAQEMRISKIMADLGYERIRLRKGHFKVRIWKKI